MPRVSDGGGRVALGISSPLTCGGEQQAGRNNSVTVFVEADPDPWLPVNMSVVIIRSLRTI